MESHHIFCMCCDQPTCININFNININFKTKININIICKGEDQ